MPQNALSLVNMCMKQDPSETLETAAAAFNQLAAVIGLHIIYFMYKTNKKKSILSKQKKQLFVQ